MFLARDNTIYYNFLRVGESVRRFVERVGRWGEILPRATGELLISRPTVILVYRITIIIIYNVFHIIGWTDGGMRLQRVVGIVRRFSTSIRPCNFRGRNPQSVVAMVTPRTFLDFPEKGYTMLLFRFSGHVRIIIITGALGVYVLPPAVLLLIKSANFFFLRLLLFPVPGFPSAPVPPHHLLVFLSTLDLFNFTRSYRARLCWPVC